ncbi:PIN domain-containing protein [Candidatus Woesearchaeota archaeon]|nr:MAG: PIN domain-containing protein [Candidatus Woesearchaeota archaeon]
MKIVPDTSVIIEGVLSKRIEHKELKCTELLIHEAVLAELEHQANKNRETGFLGLDEIKKLRELSEKGKFTLTFVGNLPSSEAIANAKRGNIDALIRNLAFEQKAMLVTADKVQALVAESKAITVLLIEIESVEKALQIEKYFDLQTMSIHLKENCTPKAKKGKPGDWEFVEVFPDAIDRETMKAMAKEIVETANMRKDGFVEMERKGSTIVQLGNFRIVITKPPLADGYEITAVRPVKKLSMEEYEISEKLKTRIAKQAEGVLISGAPGMGKSTFVQALAEFYYEQNKIIKTIEAPRDLVLPEEITQYAISHGSNEEIHDILLLSRPDYTLFDEMRNTSDFKLFSDLRLSGVGMVGVVHATNPIDAIQRFIGRIELGVIPHVIDTVIFIKNGAINRVFSVDLKVKVPAGMTEADLARPVVTVNDFETGKLEFEIYSYGEETVVVPVKQEFQNPLKNLAEQQIKREFTYFDSHAEVEMQGDQKVIVYVSDDKKARVIGRDGETIKAIEKKLGLNIDVRTRGERNKAEKNDRTESITYSTKINKKNIIFMLDSNTAFKDIDISVDGEFLMTVKASKKAMLKINQGNKIAKLILAGLEQGSVELKY